MASVQEHYDNLLADVYVWMFGGFEAVQDRYSRFFSEAGFAPQGTALAVDLGSGPGFQAIPLADAGYRVIAIDTCRALLNELKTRAQHRRIRPVHADMMSFADYVDGPLELAVCMTDTLLHLGSKDAVVEFFRQVFDSLENGGRFVLTFRDLSLPLSGADRFIPVRSDDARIFSCFLEYEPDHVNVHDLLYTKSANGWHLGKSTYKKLRLGSGWVADSLQHAGFSLDRFGSEGNMITVIARKGQAIAV